MVKKARRTWCRHQTRVGEQQNIKYSDLLKEAAVGETWPESKTKIRAKSLIPSARWEEYICKSLQALHRILSSGPDIIHGGLVSSHRGYTNGRFLARESADHKQQSLVQVVACHLRVQTKSL
jgi:hypothetical protein